MRCRQGFDGPPDGGWGWAVVAGSFAVHFVVLGLQYGFGVLFDALVDDTESFPNIDRSSAAWVSSISSALMLGGSTLSAKLINKWGCRVTCALGGFLITNALVWSSLSEQLWVLYITYGALGGLGFSFAFSSSVVNVTRYFHTKRALAIGVAVAGSGVGNIAMPVILQQLIDSLGWRAAVRVVAAGSAVLVFSAAAVYAPVRGGAVTSGDAASKEDAVAQGEELAVQDEVDLSKDEGVAPAEATAVVTRPPDRLLIAAAVFSFGYFSPFVFLVRYAKADGASEARAAVVVSVIGVSSTIGRILFGRLADLPCVNSFLLFKASVVITGVSVMIMSISGSVGLLITMAVPFGMFGGTFIALMPVVVHDLVGHRLLPQSLGAVYAVQILSVLLGPPAAGLVVEAQDGYSLAFALAGLFMFLSSLVLLWKPAEVKAVPGGLFPSPAVAPKEGDGVLLVSPRTEKGIFVQN